MTRRRFIATVVAAAPGPLVVPVHQVRDSRARLAPEQLANFRTRIWPEAARDFARCGVELRVSRGLGEIARSPGDRPVFKGLERGPINVVLTDRVPMVWDRGRGLAGISARYQGYDICVIALEEAHPHLVPLAAVNTCVHELLHVLLGDVAVSGEGYERAQREWRTDWLATRMWLFGGSADVRRAAEAYMEGRTR